MRNRANVAGPPRIGPLSSWPAIALAIIAVCWSLQYPFWPNRGALLDQGKLVDYSWLAFATFIGGIAIWLWCLWLLLPALRGMRFADVRHLVILPTSVMIAAFVLMYPTNAIDVFIYAVRSRLLTVYGENPNAAVPETYWDIDPYMHYASREWADNTSPYGPLWNLVAAPVTTLDGGNIAVAVIGFKVLSALAVVGIAWLIYLTVATVQPEWALTASLFWLWNPLVQWDGIGNAHNDVVLMLPVMGALLAWTRRNDNLVLPLLFASFLLKYVTGILLPVAAIALWRRNPDWRARLELALWSAASALFWMSVSLYPFYDLDAVWDSAREQGARISFSLAWFVMATLSRLGVANLDGDLVINGAYAIAAAGVAAWMVLTWQRPHILPRACFEVLFVFMLVASTNQRGWYVIWLVPLAAVLIPGPAWPRALAWSVGSLGGHAGSIWLWYVWDWDNWDRYWYTLIVVSVVFVPVLVVTAWQLTRSQAKPGMTQAQPMPGTTRPGQTSPR